MPTTKIRVNLEFVIPDTDLYPARGQTVKEAFDEVRARMPLFFESWTWEAHASGLYYEGEPPSFEERAKRG